MTTTNDIKKQGIVRMRELFDIAGQRCQDAGGNPRKAVNCNEWLTQEELQEFFELSNEVVTEEDVAAYVKKHGTWRDRIQAMKQSSPPAS